MERLLKIKEAAALLNVNPRHLYVLVRQKKVPYVRVGKAIRFSIEALSEWAKKGADDEVHSN